MASPPADQAQLAAITLTYQQQVQQIRDALSRYVQQLWRSLGQWRQAQIPVFVHEITPMVAGLQREVASLTSAYMAAQKQAVLGGRLAPAAVDVRRVIGADARGGASPADVYERPFHLVWRQLDELPRAPGSIDKAIEAGMNRATGLALDDLQLTKVRAGQQIRAAEPKIVGYRRVLEGAYSCGLCIVASTQRYHRKELQPIHGGCDCSSVEIFGEDDPGRFIAASVRLEDGSVVPVADLPDVHDRIHERFGSSSSAARAIPGVTDRRRRILFYRDALITHEHGELGRVLAVRGAKFTGPHDI